MDRDQIIQRLLATHRLCVRPHMAQYCLGRLDNTVSRPIALIGGDALPSVARTPHIDPAQLTDSTSDTQTPQPSQA